MGVCDFVKETLERAELERTNEMGVGPGYKPRTQAERDRDTYASAQSTIEHEKAKWKAEGAREYQQEWLKQNPNPDPSNFKLVDFEEIGQYLLVIVKYANCPTFEGKKVMVYENMKLREFLAFEVVDPHFGDSNSLKSVLNEKKAPPPIARFEPTEKGIMLAKALAMSLDAVDRHYEVQPGDDFIAS